MAKKKRSARDVARAVGALRSGPKVKAKYAADRVMGAALTAGLLPLFGAISVAIKLEDGGSVFFVQERPGLGGESFPCLKFRTMIENADDYVDEQGRPTRPRVTKVGKVLRWSSLDELPQVLNIARGDMSFIGPRPPLMVHLQRYTDGQMGRFRMKPGITGLAQVRGRNQLKWSKRLAYDNEYIDTYSLRKDAKILLQTVRVVFLREGIVEDRNPDQVDDLAPVGEWESE